MEEKNTDKSKAKKQVPLRLSKKLYDEIAQWAEDDFRDGVRQAPEGEERFAGGVRR